MQQAYDNRDVIAQIYKMMAEVADALEKATDAVSKALEAIEAAEDAGEAAEAAQQTADGKQDALTTEQLAAVDSGITAAKVAEYDGYETLPDFSQATEGDALVIGSDGPEWGVSGMQPHVFNTLGEVADAIMAHMHKCVITYFTGSGGIVNYHVLSYSPGTSVQIGGDYLQYDTSTEVLDVGKMIVTLRPNMTTATTNGTWQGKRITGDDIAENLQITTVRGGSRNVQANIFTIFY